STSIENPPFPCIPPSSLVHFQRTFSGKRGKHWVPNYLSPGQDSPSPARGGPLDPLSLERLLILHWVGATLAVALGGMDWCRASPHSWKASGAYVAGERLGLFNAHVRLQHHV